MKTQLCRTLRATRWALVVIAAYWVVRLLFVATTEEDGLISPTGNARLDVVALGGLVLALRLAVVFVVPALVTYRVCAKLLDRAS